MIDFADKIKPEMTDKQDKLLNYYSCISNPVVFKSFLYREHEFYYSNSIGKWVSYRNTQLEKNDALFTRKELMTKFNRKMGNLLSKVVSEFTHFIDWKENNTNLHPNSIEEGLSLKIHKLQLKEFPIVIKMSYDTDKFLACELQTYCINGLELMIHFLKDELLIEIEKAPCYFLLDDLIKEFKNAIDFDKAMLLLQNEPKKTKQAKSSKKQMDAQNTDLSNYEIDKPESMRIIKSNTIKSNNLHEALEYYKNTANGLNLEVEFPKVYSLLKQRQDKLKYADFENEIQEIIDDSQKALIEIKQRLLLQLRNGYLLPEYVRGYFEYKSLYEEASNRITKANTGKESKQNEDSKKQEIKYTAKHYALSYLFELNAIGEQLPTADGGLSKAALEEIGNSRIGKNGNGFYKAVKELNKDFDLNDEKQLKSISQNWKSIIIDLTNEKEKVSEYLTTKQL